ncbi:MAG: hypothetical protein D6B25_14435 [Desulfobulbaceae bacterium]|nr:MAG: hypothetical protein D6B25_14435 [Desulfobulbaceae bacterium]
MSHIGNCCKAVYKKFTNEQRAVVCKNWITPIRLTVIGSLFVHLIWRSMTSVKFYTFFLVLIHVSVALALLLECRRSQQFHKTIEEFERKEKLY